MGGMCIAHSIRMIRAYQKADTINLGFCLPVPTYLENWQDFGTLLLTCTLIGMLSTCPRACGQSEGKAGMCAQAIQRGKRGRRETAEQLAIAQAEAPTGKLDDDSTSGPSATAQPKAGVAAEKKRSGAEEGAATRCARAPGRLGSGHTDSSKM